MPCVGAYDPARLVGGDNFLVLLQEHQSSSLEDLAWAITVLGACPFGRFCEEEEEKEEEGSEQMLPHLCCQLGGV